MFDNFPPHDFPDMTFANPAPDPALHQAQDLAMRQAAGAEQQAARAGQRAQPHPLPPEPAPPKQQDVAASIGRLMQRMQEKVFGRSNS